MTQDFTNYFPLRIYEGGEKNKPATCLALIKTLILSIIQERGKLLNDKGDKKQLENN